MAMAPKTLPVAVSLPRIKAGHLDLAGDPGVEPNGAVCGVRAVAYQISGDHQVLDPRSAGELHLGGDGRVLGVDEEVHLTADGEVEVHKPLVIQVDGQIPPSQKGL